MSGTSSPTIKDIASRAGVSISTVHYALRRTRPISESTRQRVLRAVEELDYQPHAGASTLPSGRTGRLAVVIAGIEPAFANTYFSDFIRGVAGEAEAQAHTVVLYTAYGKRVQDGWRPAHILRRHEADGLVLMGTQLQDDHLDELAELAGAGQPSVLLNREHAALPWVTADRRQGAFVATSHLLATGRQAVGLLAASYPGGGPPETRPEYLGYRAALVDAGRRPDDELVAFAPVGEPADWAIAGLLRSLLGAGGSGTVAPAMLVFSYTLAPSACGAIQATGLRVPDELAIVLGDEDPDARDGLDVPLTTVKAPKFAMGQCAVGLLLRLMRDEQVADDERRQRVPMALAVRRSCGARRRLA